MAEIHANSESPRGDADAGMAEQPIEAKTETPVVRKTRLKHLEGVIRRGMQTFIEVGEALAEIRDDNLYELDYESFDDYCLAEFGWGKRNGDRQIRAARAAKQLGPHGLEIPNEAQAREMAKLAHDPEAAARVWKEVGEANGGKHPAKALQRAIEREKEIPPLQGYPPRQGGVARPPVRQFGGKWRMARSIVALFPEHRVYVEPYMGSAAIFLTKASVPVEIINDIDKEAVNLFKVIREHREELERVVRDTPYSEAEFDLAATLEDDARNLGEIERARRFLVRSHQGVLRQQGKASFSVSPGATSREMVKLWNELPKHFEAAKKRLKGARILNREALDVARDYNAPDVLVYCDPPYLTSTRTPEQYRHEMPNDPEHEKLMDALIKHKGMVFLSGYASDEYDSTLKGWESKVLRGYSSRGLRKETVWMNPLAAAGVRAAAERAAKREAEEKKASQAPMGMGMVYRPPSEAIPESEAPEVAAVFGALLEGWRGGKGED